MNKLIVFCLFLAVASLEAHNVQLSQSQKEKVHQYSMDCIKESGVKPEMIVEAKKGHFADDANLKKFTLCFLKKTGIINKEGKLDVEVALAKLPAGADKNAIKKVLEECKNKSGKDKADTAFEIFKCYHKATPTHVVF